MANVVIISVDSSIQISFNVFASKYKLDKIIRKKIDFSFDLLPDDNGVVINVASKLSFTVHWDIMTIVDSVNGEAPTSNSDLYNKLSGLLISTENFTTLLDAASSTITYIGKGLPSSDTSNAVWSISRLDSTSGVMLLWANGNGYFDKIWDDRASYSYS